MVSLVLGLTCVFLILLWVQNELSYDRFHEDAGRISLVLRGDSKESTAMTSTMLAPALETGIAGSGQCDELYSLPAGLSFLVQNGSKGFDENISLAATNFFELFSFKFKRDSGHSVVGSEFHRHHRRRCEEVLRRRRCHGQNADALGAKDNSERSP